jgi:transposase InsO family protein
MILDDDIVAVSPSTVYRVLKAVGRLDGQFIFQGKRIQAAEKPHDHWRVDISCLNVDGTFYYLITVLDGYSRYIVHFDLRESMTEVDVEIVCQAALEKHPGVRPRIISDNGPQFIAKDFKAFVRFSGMTPVTTSPYYPQSNGKLERFHGTIKKECIRPTCPRTCEEAMRQISACVKHYDEVRLHSEIGYITPAECLCGLGDQIHAERNRKLEEARVRRRGKSNDKSLALAS